VAQSVTIEKGQHLKMVVEYVEEMPSKNPAWDSRWKVDGLAANGVGVTTFIGNKAMLQQTGRLKMTPENLRGKTCIFERTVEGYLNILVDGGKPKTPPVELPVAGGDEVVREEAAPSEVLEKVAQMREERRLRVSEDITWAFEKAHDLITLAMQSHEMQMGPEALRAMVALAATIHISYKDAR
jgi:hypothetical protein